MSDYNAVSARLLANENITVVRRKTKTASFDVESRVLTVPQYKDLDPQIEDLFVCHEIGHALFTDKRELKRLFPEGGDTFKYFNYMNVTEDVRCDRKVKEKYPGSRKSFREGYKALHDRDFFGLNDNPVEGRSFGDRLNLFYKGLADTIQFDNEVERTFARRALEEVETMQDAYDLAVEIYQYDEENFQDDMLDQESDFGYGSDGDSDEDEEQEQSTPPQSKKSEQQDTQGAKKKQPKQKQKSESGDQQESGESESGESDEDSSESDSSKSQGKGSSKDTQDTDGESDSSDGEESDGESDEESDGEGDEDSEDDEDGEFSDRYDNTPKFDGKIQSQSDLDAKIQNFVDGDREYIDLRFSMPNGFDPVIGYKTVLQETAFADTARPSDCYRYSKAYEGTLSEQAFTQYVTEFKAEARETISYLKKEFDMRKSAEQIRRAQVNKSGQLDSRKLYAYKMKDDIFKRNIIIRDEKNHGMIFLLDWSSSMMTVMQKTIEQVYVLASFCRVCNIPFRVLAFSSQASNKSMNYDKERETWQTHVVDVSCVRPYKLIEFFNSNMTLQEFNTMANRLLRTTIWDSSDRNPFTFKYVLGNTPLNSALTYMLHYLPVFKSKANLEKVTLITLTDGVSHGMLENTYTATWKNNYSFVSPINQKRYDVMDNEGLTPGKSNIRNEIMETATLIRMIKDTGVKTIGLNITENGYKSVRSALMTSSASFLDSSHDSVLTARKEDSYVLPKSFYDLAIVFPRMLKNEEETEMVDRLGEFTAKGIAKQFMKHNKNKRRRRIFLDAFVSTIA